MELNKNQIVDLEITGMTSEGYGVGKYNQFALFIPHSAVGDQLKVKIVKLQSTYGYGIIEEIVHPSSDRIVQTCAAAAQCGGCCYRHISYEAECRIKQQTVQDNLKKIGGIEMQVEPILPSPRWERYRNKAQYPVSGTASDPLVGFYAKRSHRMINAENCFLQPEIFTFILQDIKGFIKKHKIVPYNEEKHTGLLRHIYLRIGEATGEIMVCLVVNGNELPETDQLISLLSGKYPQIKSIVLNINQAKSNIILGPKCITLFGADSITDILCGLTFQISPLSFYQVNRQGAENLYNLVKEHAAPQKDEVLLDLYCGTGTIGLTMAKDVRKLIGVEIIADAVKNARQNAQLNHIENAEFFCSDAKGATIHFLQNCLYADTIIIDPPRKGCDSEVLQALVKMSPKKIVMVSCNSATMARDCRYLTDNGFEIKKVNPIDMFPRTEHVECVTLMSRAKEWAWEKPLYIKAFSTYGCETH